MTMRAVNRTRGTVLCAAVESAGGVLGKGRGLMGRAGLERGRGMLFEAGALQPFMWMHMFFMRFAIDIVFLDRRGKVLQVNRGLRPWRFSSIVLGARRALEVAAGEAAVSSTEPGDQIDFEPA